MGIVKAERLIAIDGEIVAELHATVEVRDKWAESPEMRSRGSRAKNQIGHHKGDSGKITNLEIRRGSTRKELIKAAFRQESLENLNKILIRNRIDGRRAMQFKSIEEFDAFIN